MERDKLDGRRNMKWQFSIGLDALVDEFGQYRRKSRAPILMSQAAFSAKIKSSSR
jgi:hypothetical protein